MSLQEAIQFIRQVRTDHALRDKIEALGSEADLKSIARIGTEAGFAFTPEDLQAAFKHDWAMRWLHYSTKHPYETTTRTPEHRKS